MRGALVIGAASEALLVERLRAMKAEADAGRAPAPATPSETDLRAPERLAIDYADATELGLKAGQALKAIAANQAALWKALRAQGIFRGHGPAPKVAFLYTGQGSQYVNMLQSLRAIEPIVAETFAEADRVMTPLLGKPLTKFIFIDATDAAAVVKAEDDLRQTAITQPAVLATDMALTRLLAAYGVQPDFTMGHSLGEYGALIASGALPFADALEAVSARGREMTRVSLADNGRMAAVFAPLAEIERILKTIDGYIVVANINSQNQAVVGGSSKAVELAINAFQQAGYEVAALPVSHAFHTSIVAPASEPLRETLQRLRLQPPRIPIIANVDGEFYPAGADVVPRMLDILAQQVASPVQFIKGLNTLYEAGARVFVELGPKKALQGFAEDVLGNRGDVLSLFTNHPKFGDLASFNQALCGLYAAGLGRGKTEGVVEEMAKPAPVTERVHIPQQSHMASSAMAADVKVSPRNGDRYHELGRMFADVLERGWQLYGKSESAAPTAITGAALGLPGAERIFDDENIGRILQGEQFIDAIPNRLRHAMLDKHITRLVKSDNGGPTFETIGNVAEVIKLAGRGGAFDLEHEFGVPADRLAALDRTTQLAIAVGIDALRDAGIPLVMRYKTTTRNTQLPDRWSLPEALRDETGVIFASAFPGCDSFSDEMSRYYADRNRREQLAMLESLRARMAEMNGSSLASLELDRRLEEVRAAIGKDPYVFDRRFLFRVLAMGHSQFAEYIGARGPNTAVNAACASTTQAVGLAEDWIRAGKCRRVVVISADDVTSDHMMEWFGAGFLATGAASTDQVVEDAALPFDRRRHGMIVGMGAAALVVESAEAARERGLAPICEVLSAVTANSAFHGTRLDVQHISQVMESLVRQAEQRHGIRRQDIAPRTVFVSHETYTPARGGSAAAEIFALRHVFGDAADRIVIANTKGFTGHAMAAGIEDVVAVKALETGCVPAVANFKEVDPELGSLNLSKGGLYPIDYALRLGAGFGSQISMTLVRWVPTRDRIRPHANALGYAYRIADPAAWKEWLSRTSGYAAADLEVVHRTLRVRDHGPVAQAVQAAEPVAAPAPVAVPAPPAPVTEVQLEPTPATTTKLQTPAKVSEPASVPRSAPQSDQGVKDRVLAVVAEKTGYPVDMLELDLDLEADLGVDTVKQAEVFAAIREAYSIPRDEQLKLRDFPTLAHVIRFVEERRPDLQSSKPTPEVVKESQQPQEFVVVVQPERVTPNGDVKERVLALVVEKTGYPRDMLDLDLDLEADLGIDTVKQAEMFAAIREIYNIPRDENRKLRDYPTLAHVIRFVEEKRPSAAAAVSATLAEAKPVSTTVLPTANSEDSIRQKVLQIVKEKTGYPQDMLDLELDLEADLGVDTVKQAEMFAAVRAAYGIPRDENLKLRDFPTLASVIKFARDRQHASAEAPRANSATAANSKAAGLEAAAAVDARPEPLSLDAANRIPRRVPVPVLRPPLDLCKSTGITLERSSRVVLFPDKGGAGEALAKQLRTMGVEVLSLENVHDADVLTERLKTWMAAGPIQGVYWLPALDCEGDIRKMNRADWQQAVKLRLKLLYATMRPLYEQIAAPGTFLVSATRLGGQHGYDETGAVAPLGGAVTGFTKAYKRERPEALVKVVDFAPECNSQEVATSILQETLSDPGAVEIGYKQNLRWTFSLLDQPASNGQPGMSLGKDTVFLITGAAGSIVSAITADLAAASSGTFYLLDVA
ncbi:MAG TPA: acyltransferase domain-containing protein, partial [Terriglobales bacterium]|nr:acyltransferase domain-containing protein [Terriglobales bacterium]